MNLDNLLPINDKHSIKEAVIGLFLDRPFDNPAGYEQLFKDHLNKEFQKFEQVGTIEFKLNSNSKKETRIENENAGFRLISYSEGNTSLVLQGINEINRTFLSFHTLSYSRWKQFKSDFFRIIKHVNDFSSPYLVKAISLHYVDEFNWIGDSRIPLDQLFNDNSDYLPKNFLMGSEAIFKLFNRFLVNTYDYYNRLEIDSTRSLKISHNIIHTLDKATYLSDLLSDETSSFEEYLDTAHLHNKSILKSILNSDIQSKIGLI